MRRWLRQCLEAQQLQFIDKTVENPCPDAAADPSSSDRAANDSLVTQTELPTIQKTQKIVELPQVQFHGDEPMMQRQYRPFRRSGRLSRYHRRS